MDNETSPNAQKVEAAKAALREAASNINLSYLVVAIGELICDECYHAVRNQETLEAVWEAFGRYIAILERVRSVIDGVKLS